MEDNKYSRGKIYKLVPKIINNDEEQLIYIGSTCEKLLSNRLAGHRKDYKYYNKNIDTKKLNKFTSYKLFDKYGVNNVDIIILLEYSCNNKYELHAKEREYIENNVCVNKYIPNRTFNEWREDNKE